MAETRVKFEDLPQKIQRWLTSEKAAEISLGLNEKYGLSHKPEVIPGLIFDVVSKAIHPKDLIDILEKDLGIEKEKGQQIAKEIKENILYSVREELLGVGVNIDHIDVSEGSSKPEPPKKEELAPIRKPTPFLLHQEKDFEPNIETKPESETHRTVFFKNSEPSDEAAKSEPNPVTAKLEIGAQEQIKKEPQTTKTPQEQIRVVHYSQFHTPTDPFSGKPLEQKPFPQNNSFSLGKDVPLNKNTIDLREKERKIDSPEKNTIDLR